MNLTPPARIILGSRQKHLERVIADGREAETQENILRRLLKKASRTVYGSEYGFEEILADSDIRNAYRASVPTVDYNAILPYIRRMLYGEAGILWPGICRRFAQSSGTSGDKSKYIPLTGDSLRLNHYAGASAAVSRYLRQHPESRLFSGKGLILGGSFACTASGLPEGTKAGDLSASLIECISPLAGFFRIPDKKTALMSDWNEKLPAIAAAAAGCRNLTNISGVPSWMGVLLHRILETTGLPDLHALWPGLEVFFHGGISFEPYREEYARLCGPKGINYFENYNASEGFFAIQREPEERGMLLLPDIGIYYEFLPLSGENPLKWEEVRTGEIYELMISAPNGLWRYRTGDTVKIEDNRPLTITIAGRTKTFINAFGEELMEHNAERAIAAACAATGSSVANYTAAPLFASGERRARHQWLIEWSKAPASATQFASVLDRELRQLNSDYDAKRTGDIFLAPPQIIEARHGLFNDWMAESGNGKLGGQRKVPRLSNTRDMLESMLRLQ